MNKINELLNMNVNEYTEKKNGLTYLSWSHAWGNFIKVYPDATYKIIKDELNNCYWGNNENGYMVYTEVTAGGITHEMWLPVMDFRNKSMLKPTTFDINKAVMRCLTKNLAMFGLGLYIYAGEDLPEDNTEPTQQEKTTTNTKTPEVKKVSEKQVKMIYTALKGDETREANIKKFYKVESMNDLTSKQADAVIKKLMEE